jgi:hypothetical protein
LQRGEAVDARELRLHYLRPPDAKPSKHKGVVRPSTERSE